MDYLSKSMMNIFFSCIFLIIYLLFTWQYLNANFSSKFYLRLQCPKKQLNLSETIHHTAFIFLFFFFFFLLSLFKVWIPSEQHSGFVVNILWLYRITPGHYWHFVDKICIKIYSQTACLANIYHCITFISFRNTQSLPCITLTETFANNYPKRWREKK